MLDDAASRASHVRKDEGPSAPFYKIPLTTIVRKILFARWNHPSVRLRGSEFSIALPLFFFVLRWMERMPESPDSHVCLAFRFAFVARRVVTPVCISLAQFP